MRTFLPSVTLLMIDCVNYERARRVFDHCLNVCDFGSAKLLTCNPLTTGDVLIEPITDIKSYSAFMINNLVEHFDTDHCLVIQHDGYIMTPAAWTDDFLAYDYIGAPWGVGFLQKGVNHAYRVGNGGFSLRSKRLQQMLAASRLAVQHPEDVAVCQVYRPALELLGMKFAPLDVATRFSVEWGVLNGQFGQHGSELGQNGELVPGIVQRVKV